MRRSLQRPRRGSAGFSIVEMLIVVGILGVVAIVGVPALLNQLSRLRMESTANDIANLVRQTRLRAIRDNNSYTVGIGGSDVVGMGLQGDIERVVPALPALPYWRGNGVIVLEFNDPDVSLYPALAWTADCQDQYDLSNPGAEWDGDVIVYDGTGVATEAGALFSGTPGTGAICIWDGGENVLQVVLQYPSGQPQVRKFLKPGDSPSGQNGFFAKISAATSTNVWVWY